MDLDAALEFARPRHQGVLITLRRDGRPQVSNILFMFDEARTARISVTASRAKAKNVARDPRCALYVPGDSFWSYVTFDGTAALSPVAAAPDDEVVDELVAMYRQASGEHPDWDEYRRVMVEEGRMVLRFTAERATGIANAAR